METFNENTILFKLKKWEIHPMLNNFEKVRVYHHCKKWYSMAALVGAYSDTNRSTCYGCGAIKPDEIQGLEIMYNWEK